MRQRRIRTLAAALVVALHPGIACAQDAEGLRLKVERLLRMAPTRPERDSAKFLEADRIVGDQERDLTATGNVTLRQRGATIRADRVDYSGEKQTAVATGNVVIERDGDTVSGPALNYSLADDTGEMTTPTFEFPKKAERRTSSRGEASLAVLGENKLSRLYDAKYTSCPVPRDDWFIKVRELHVDGTRNVGTAYDTAVYFLGVPILYSPWLSFPLDNERKTGFLAPTLGTSGRSGFEVSLPFYWNIAENRDATLTPKIFSKRGIQLGAEFRYLEPKFSGQLDGEFLPHDRIAGSDRWLMGVRHGQQLWGGLGLALNAQRVSDDDYFRDLSTRIAATSQTNLPRDAILGYGDDVWSLQARTLAYQTLQDPNGPPVPIPYRILPRLLATAYKQDVGGLDLSLYSELSNFRHPELVTGQRAIAYPSVSYPMRRSYGYVVPKLGYHVTRYNLEENVGALDAKATRSMPIASLDSGLFFDRDMRWGDRAFQQTLEPRVFYLYAPFRDQSRLPNFTTAEADFNFAQIFTENRFVGGDRVGDANQVTIALTSRMIESATGLERFKASVGQVYYFDPPRVTLGQTTGDGRRSDIVAIASSQMAPSVSVEAGLQYTPNLTRSQKFGFGAQYHPEPGRIVNAAYRYARGEIEQVDVSSQWPITANLSGLGRLNWSLKDRKVLEGLAGFEYNAGCWQLRAVAHRFISATQQYSTSFQIQLELTGLSRIGINPLETLRQNIAGYRRSDEIAR